ncbi:MAG: two-component system, OmpR family, sensor kinase [Actinomycetota bacterium]|jgi:DNA-binding NarL/FixJ family response regulator
MAKAATATRTKKAPAKKPPFKKPRAVICDDDAMSRQLARAALERCGYEVLAGVGTALEALQLVMTYQPDVLMLDLVLPAMNGEDIVIPIQRGAPDCTIVISSSHDPSAAIHNGASYIVPKGQTKRLEDVLTMLAARLTG